MAYVVPIVVAATAVIGAAAAVRQGQVAQATADYNRKVNEQNSQIAKQEADALARQKDRETFMRLGAIAVAQGKSGGVANEGSVLDVIGESAAQSELDKQWILYRGALGERQYQNNAVLDAYGGKAGQTAGYLKAGSELLSGASGTFNAASRVN